MISYQDEQLLRLAAFKTATDIEPIRTQFSSPSLISMFHQPAFYLL